MLKIDYFWFMFTFRLGAYGAGSRSNYFNNNQLSEDGLGCLV